MEAEKGRRISVNWSELEELLHSEDEVSVLSATLKALAPHTCLEIGIDSCPGSSYLEVSITSESIQYHVGDTEYSQERFQEFGAAYWNAFASRTHRVAESVRIVRS